MNWGLLENKILLTFIDWPYRDKFNNALLELQEQGVLAQLKQKWWNEVGAGVCNVSKSEERFTILKAVIKVDTYTMVQR